MLLAYLLLALFKPLTHSVSYKQLKTLINCFFKLAVEKIITQAEKNKHTKQEKTLQSLSRAAQTIWVTICH